MEGCIRECENWDSLANNEKYYENQQRELYLLDQRDTLDERRNPTGSPSPAEEAQFQNTKINSQRYILGFGKLPKSSHASGRNGWQGPGP